MMHALEVEGPMVRLPGNRLLGSAFVLQNIALVVPFVLRTELSWSHSQLQHLAERGPCCRATKLPTFSDSAPG